MSYLHRIPLAMGCVSLMRHGTEPRRRVSMGRSLPKPCEVVHFSHRSRDSRTRDVSGSAWLIEAVHPDHELEREPLVRVVEVDVEGGRDAVDPLHHRVAVHAERGRGARR